MDQNNQNHYLNIIVKLLQEQQNSPFHEKKSTENINKMYETVKNILAQFQQQVNRCKQYNEAKAHRKYQIIIKNLQEQNSKLKQKVKQEQQARPGSQMYVSRLITQLIDMKAIKSKLQKQLAKSQENVRKLQEKYEPHMMDKNKSKQETKESNQNIKHTWQKIIIKENLDNFLKNQERLSSISTIQNKQNANFKKFLQHHRIKIQRGDFYSLLQRIERWTNNLKEARFLNKDKIIHHFERSLLYRPDINTAIKYTKPIDLSQLTIQIQKNHSIRKKTTNNNPQQQKKNQNKTYILSKLSHSVKKC